MALHGFSFSVKPRGCPPEVSIVLWRRCRLVGSSFGQRQGIGTFAGLLVPQIPLLDTIHPIVSRSQHSVHINPHRGGVHVWLNLEHLTQSVRQRGSWFLVARRCNYQFTCANLSQSQPAKENPSCYLCHPCLGAFIATNLDVDPFYVDVAA